MNRSAPVSRSSRESSQRWTYGYALHCRR